jgi:hypothetical protein
MCPTLQATSVGDHAGHVLLHAGRSGAGDESTGSDFAGAGQGDQDGLAFRSVDFFTIVRRSPSLDRVAPDCKSTWRSGCQQFGVNVHRSATLFVQDPPSCREPQLRSLRLIRLDLGGATETRFRPADDRRSTLAHHIHCLVSPICYRRVERSLANIPCKL